MSQSIDGILFFGFEVKRNDEFCFPWENLEDAIEEDDWERSYAVRKGIDPDNFSAIADAIKVEHAALGYHGYCEGDAQYFVALKATVFFTAAGEVKPIPVIAIANGLELEISLLQEFCNLMSIPWQEPAWHLCAYKC
jgi:hypothetical protein